jgi:hypothetical protein
MLLKRPCILGVYLEKLSGTLNATGTNWLLVFSEYIRRSEAIGGTLMLPVLLGFLQDCLHKFH